MVVTTTSSTNGTIVSYSGTLQEVINALDAAELNDISNTIIYYNGTNITAVTIAR